MTSEKLANHLEKLSAKVEGIKHNFQNEEHQASFDTMKTDVIALLEEMSQLAHEDAESEEMKEETNESND